MNAYMNELVQYLVAQSWQIAVLTMAVAMATFALRHRSAHVRYLLWLIVVAKCGSSGFCVLFMADHPTSS